MNKTDYESIKNLQLNQVTNNKCNDDIKVKDEAEAITILFEKKYKNSILDKKKN